MDYVVGSVAALISGNVTPNRPKLIRRALTPTKHQPSPNVTPKSEFVEDRSIFLSPTLQKKKAIVKKSPKRIFQNPDLDSTEDCEGNLSTSPKADKVKKHLKDDLEVDVMAKKKSLSDKSLNESLNKPSEVVSPKKKNKSLVEPSRADSTPKKKKKRNSESNVAEKDEVLIKTEVEQGESVSVSKSPKKMKQRRKSTADINNDSDEETNTQSSPKQSQLIDNQETEIKQNKKKNKKRKKNKTEQIQHSEDTKPNLGDSPKKKGKKNKSEEIVQKTENTEMGSDSESENEESNIANPNAITEKDSDSEHDSDNEIESENEEENTNNQKEDNPSSDEEEEEQSSKSPKKKDKAEKDEKMTEEEVKRTLFVGNVPFSSKCKKEIKKIFSKFGQIETVRIRTIPVKDARVTPKLAIIKNELHPERSTVNVYVKFASEQSVAEALSANNTVLNNHHLRVSRSISTGAEHDPKLAVFVGNLPFAIEDETLRAKFERCGEIESVRVVRDKKTNAGKGFGYVNFATKDGVELALAMTEEDLTIKNRILRVNRCTQSGSKGLRKPPNQKFGGKFNRDNQNRRQGDGRSQGKTQRWNQDRGNQGRGFQDRGFQGNQDRGFQSRGNQGFQGKGNQGFQGKGNQDRGFQDKGNQFKGNQRNQDGKSWGQKEETGAARRLMNKRKQQDAGEGPSNKKPNISREKKPKKEFVGITAEKKKKQKFNKDAKKKKALSEILTKKSS